MACNDWLSKKLIYILGKGGVGKTLVAQATARSLAQQGKRTLLCHVLQISEKEQRLEHIAPHLWEVYLNSSTCFEEYIVLKIRLKSLYTLLLGNRVTKYLEKAAPGVREMVLLGKTWFERLHYDHIVVDMPSTGYALTMLNTPFNFAAVFPGGPIYNDAKEMIKTFSDSQTTAFVTVSLAEEMPIQETVELAQHLEKILPDNLPWLVVNRAMHNDAEIKKLHSKKWESLSKEEALSPFWQALDYRIQKEKNQKAQLEGLNKINGSFHEPRNWMELPELALDQDHEKIAALSGILRKPSSETCL